MRAALGTRLRGAASGPLLEFDQELARFRPWLSPRLRPLLVRLGHWQRRYRQAESVPARLAVERQALDDLRSALVTAPSLPLVRELLARLDRAHTRSLAERRRALEGKNCDPQLDERLLQELLTWLEGQSGEPELGALLARLLRAWWAGRRGGATAPHSPVNPPGP